MSTIIVWFRNDLRLHDHPALYAATQAADAVVPVFICNPQLLCGTHASPNRNRFLQECLEDLRRNLQAKGGDLVIRSGDAATELQKIAKTTKATAIYATADYTPYATRRDQKVQMALRAAGTEVRFFPGRLAVDAIEHMRTSTGKPYQIFTPFWRQWQRQPRREVIAAPAQLPLPDTVDPGDMPQLVANGDEPLLSPDALQGGEHMAHQRLEAFLAIDIKRYHAYHDDLAADSTSRLSSYLHFGCVSVRDIEDRLPAGDGPAAFHRQLAWRDFYHYVIHHYPENARHEFQARYRTLAWDDDPQLLAAWQHGRTGYPIVDAAMRQLRQEGWMHNRARLIVGSFLTKDLGLDWRHGERHFMQWLLDGDQANNNGNWQWIASVGVDPAPLFRRLYNPTSQQARYDPAGAYVRRFVPELALVPDEFLAEPWRMDKVTQRHTRCVIGQDYPAPVVNHAVARAATLERYRNA